MSKELIARLMRDVFLYSEHEKCAPITDMKAQQFLIKYRNLGYGRILQTRTNI